ncbi:hypothetical protein ACOZFK_33315, partial [Streptomyces pseudogriseolus]
MQTLLPTLSAAPGVHVPGHTACLAHLTNADRDAYLAGLTPGASIDRRGTTFTDPLLSALLNALRAPATGHPHLLALTKPLDVSVGDQADGESEEGLVDVVASFP